MELSRLKSEQVIIEQRRDQAASAFYEAEKMRTEMIMHFERS